ncbi:MAG: hypothetical protein ACR2O0_16030 [Rhizobiaceae bacterium]
MRSNRNKRIIGGAFVVTAIWLFTAVLIVLFWSAQCPDLPADSGWTKRYLDCRPPNEIGDFLAGIFATLAFIWLMVAVFLQSMELAAQREELSLTREELKEQRKVMRATMAESRKQAEFIGQQTEILRSEQTSREQSEADDLFRARCAKFFEELGSAKYSRYHYITKSKKNVGQNLGQPNRGWRPEREEYHRGTWSKVMPPRNSSMSEKTIPEFVRSLDRFISNPSPAVIVDKNANQFLELQRQFDELRSSLGNLSPKLKFQIEHALTKQVSTNLGTLARICALTSSKECIVATKKWTENKAKYFAEDNVFTNSDFSVALSDWLPNPDIDC